MQRKDLLSLDQIRKLGARAQGRRQRLDSNPFKWEGMERYFAWQGGWLEGVAVDKLLMRRYPRTWGREGRE